MQGGKKKAAKKRPAQKAPYARGKPVGRDSRGAGATSKTVSKEVRVGKDRGDASRKESAGKERGAAGREDERGTRSEFNIIRRGTIEMKVFQALLAFVIAGGLLQFPLWKQVSDRDYVKIVKEYRQELRNWENEQRGLSGKKKEEHEKKRPVKPVKPSFSIFVFYYLLMFALQGALLLFLGLNVARRVGLKTPIIDDLCSGRGGARQIGELLLVSIPWGIAVSVLLFALHLLQKYSGFMEVADVRYPIWKNAMYLAGFSVQNVVLFVFLVMSGLIWVFGRFRDRLKFEPNIAGLVSTTALAFLYFFLLSGKEGKVSSLVITSAFLSISLVAIPGYLHWKRGFEFSLLSGFYGFALYPVFVGFMS